MYTQHHSQAIVRLWAQLWNYSVNFIAERQQRSVDISIKHFCAVSRCLSVGPTWWGDEYDFSGKLASEWCRVEHQAIKYSEEWPWNMFITFDWRFHTFYQQRQLWSHPYSNIAYHECSPTADDKQQRSTQFLQWPLVGIILLSRMAAVQFILLTCVSHFKQCFNPDVWSSWVEF